jgi:colanic acid biosynthesis glycosyl transferase WcaI
MTRSKVLILGLNYAPEHTGIAPYTAGIAQGLSRDYDVQVVTAHPHYPAWEISDGYGSWRQEELQGSVAVLRLRHYVPSNPTGPTRIFSEISFAVRAHAARVQRPDVVLSVSPALLPVLSAHSLAKRWGIPLGVVVQDLYSRAMVEVVLLGGRSGGSATRLESHVLRGADGLVAIHDRFAKTMVDRLGVDPNLITVIPNWTHVQASHGLRDSTRRRLGWEGQTVVLHAGNMGAKQGLDHVIAAAALTDQSKGPLKIVLMGDGNQRGDLEQRAKGNRSIDIIDGVPDSEFPDVLAAADILLLHERPGVVEMCVPSKLTSYFAAGRPVLAATSARSAAAEEIRASGAGMVVEPGDPAALLNGVRSLASRPGSNEMGSRGQAYARESLSEVNALDAYRAWVDRLLAGASTPLPSGSGTSTKR